MTIGTNLESGIVYGGRSEGLRGKAGGLHPLQQAFMKHFAIECGYCTPGMILTGGR